MSKLINNKKAYCIGEKQSECIFAFVNGDREASVTIRLTFFQSHALKNLMCLKNCNLTDS